MKSVDRNAVNSFNPDKGIYLVMAGSGKNKHIEARQLKALNIPILGYFLKKIGYPSLRFRKVVDYILTQEAPLHKVDDKKKQLLQARIKDYFGLGEENNAHRHLKQWKSVSAKYAEVFGVQQPEIAEAIRHHRDITVFTRDAGDEDNAICQLPDDMLRMLPGNEKYVITRTFETCRPIVGWEHLVEKLEDEVKTFAKPPVVLVLCLPHWYEEGEDFACLEGAFEQLKTKKLIREYCPIYREGTRARGIQKWEVTKDINEKSIKDLSKRLLVAEKTIDE